MFTQTSVQAVRPWRTALWSFLTDHRTLFWALILLGIAVRAYRFGSPPFGLNQDEASSGYDAFSIWVAGMDRNGLHLPMAFPAWGLGVLSFSVYATVPFLQLFGVSVWTIRLPYLIAGIASLFLFYGIAREIGGKRLGLCALFLLVLSPWHVMTSRWALDCNMVLLPFLGGVYLLLRSEQRPWLLVPAFCCFALCPYAYATTIVVVPLFLAGALLLLAVRRSLRLWPFLSACAAFGIITLPMAAFVFINRYTGHESIVLPFLTIPKLSAPEFNEVATHASPFSIAFWTDAASRLRELWGLVLAQTDGHGYNIINGYGYLLHPSSNLLVAGGLLLCIFGMLRRRKEAILFGWIGGMTVAAVLIGNGLNINRMNLLFPALILLGAMGLRALSRLRMACVAVVCLLLFSFAGFVRTYYEGTTPVFHQGLMESLLAVKESGGNICVTDRGKMTYVFVLLAHEVNPRFFRETVHYQNPGSAFQMADHFGRYTIGLDACDKSLADAFVVERSEWDAFLADPQYAVQSFGDYAAVTRKATISLR